MTTVAIMMAVAVGLLAGIVAVAKTRPQGPGPEFPSAPRPPDLSALDDEAFRDRVLGEIQGGRKIEAIKLVRERTRLGLAEAKALVDAVERGDASIDLDLVPTSSLDNATVALNDPGLAARLVVEIAAGRKIEAIKLLRERTGLGLKEAKDAIDALERDD
jgi:ribosomal protein L7/L12